MAMSRPILLLPGLLCFPSEFVEAVCFSAEAEVGFSRCVRPERVGSATDGCSPLPQCQYFLPATQKTTSQVSRRRGSFNDISKVGSAATPVTAQDPGGRLHAPVSIWAHDNGSTASKRP